MRVDHIAMNVTNLDERVSTFCKLGMTVRRKGNLSTDPSRRIVMLSDGWGFKIELIESPGDGVAHVAIAADNVDDRFAELLCTGLEPQRAPHRLEPAKARSAMLSDEFGLAVQLVHYDNDSPDL